MSSNKAKSDKEVFDLTSIPFSSLLRVRFVFMEGKRKYGAGNWRAGAGDVEYQIERANHAIKHLLLYVHKLQHHEVLGVLGEDDLAKVAWFCLTQMELERIEKSESFPCLEACDQKKPNAE